MRSYDHFIRLVAMVGLAITGMFATALVSALVLMMAGMSMSDLVNMGQSGMEGMSAGMIRMLLATQHLCIFILPALVFGLIFYRPNILKGFDLAKSPGVSLSFLGIVFLIAAYPLVNLSFLLNEAIPLPSWAGDLESQAEETLKKILIMDTPIIFLINLTLIAILPGIGEELLFRGIVQKQLSGWLKNPIAAIWISAFIFSAIHMQFEGFFPRVVLGAILGYLYHWTNNLWVPIIAHAFNNGIQVVLIYAMDIDLAAFEEQGSDQLKWWMIPLSVGVMYMMYWSIQKNRSALE